MTSDKTPAISGASAPADTRGKRAYVKPAFRYERVFETSALGCGKIGGTGGICNSVPKLS